MPVVINEFEVVNEPPSSQTRSAPETNQPAPPPPDVERILVVVRARHERVRVY